jgi:formylmethanofuran dehydrogenase subunit A
VAVVGAVDPHVNSVRTASINLGRIIRRAQEARRVAAQQNSPGFAVGGLLAPSFLLVVVSCRTEICQVLPTLHWYDRFKEFLSGNIR